MSNSVQSNLEALLTDPCNPQFWHRRWANKETLSLRDEVMRSLGDSLNVNLSEEIISKANSLLDSYWDENVWWTPIMLVSTLAAESEEFHTMALDTMDITIVP